MKTKIERKNGFSGPWVVRVFNGKVWRTWGSYKTKKAANERATALEAIPTN